MAKLTCYTILVEVLRDDAIGGRFFVSDLCIFNQAYVSLDLLLQVSIRLLEPVDSLSLLLSVEFGHLELIHSQAPFLFDSLVHLAFVKQVNPALLLGQLGLAYLEG